MKKLDLENVRIYSNVKRDIIDAMDLIGEEVYMSDWEDFNPHSKGKLISVVYSEDSNYSFFCKHEGQNRWGCRFFILAKDAKFVEEKKLRPFKDVEEFRTTIGCAIGNVITYKKKDSDAEYTVLFNGYVRVNGNVLGIYLGRRSHTLEELRNDYLYLCVDEWKPFGVEE